jgi:hypothetical protein
MSEGLNPQTAKLDVYHTTLRALPVLQMLHLQGRIEIAPTEALRRHFEDQGIVEEFPNIVTTVGAIASIDAGKAIKAQLNSSFKNPPLEGL